MFEMKNICLLFSCPDMVGSFFCLIWVVFLLLLFLGFYVVVLFCFLIENI